MGFQCGIGCECFRREQDVLEWSYSGLGWNLSLRLINQHGQDHDQNPHDREDADANWDKKAAVKKWLLIHDTVWMAVGPPRRNGLILANIGTSGRIIISSGSVSAMIL
jgi:hypothetical protein